MANPVKAAKQMFEQFLGKHDPDASQERLEEIGERELASLSDAHDLASKGGYARVATLSPKKRRQIAK